MSEPTHAAPLLPASMARRSRSQELADAAAAKRAEADRIAGNAGVDDAAAGRLNAHNLKQVHRNTDSSLRRYTEAVAAADALDHKSRLAAGREAEAARTHLTRDDVKGAVFVRDRFGWHRVVKVNQKTVTVETPYSWTETIPLDKLLQVKKTQGGCKTCAECDHNADHAGDCDCGHALDVS